jgi:hypothetical protein
MPHIQVHAPEHIYRRLVEEAAAEHRSLAQQIVAVLARALGMDQDAKARRKRLLESVRSSRFPTQGLADPVLLVRKDRKR